MARQVAAMRHVDEVLAKQVAELRTEDTLAGSLPSTQNDRGPRSFSTVLDCIGHPRNHVVVDLVIGSTDMVVDMFQEP